MAIFTVFLLWILFGLCLLCVIQLTIKIRMENAQIQQFF